MIRSAKQEEINKIKTWLQETANSLQEKGIQQWQTFLTAEGRKIVESDFHKEYLYVYTNDADESIASISICAEEEWDASLWKDKKEAYYLHRIVVSKEGKGCNIGTLLLTWAKAKAREDGRVLRLDCVEDNSFLVSFYKQEGFKQERIVDGFALFEAEK